MDNFVFSNELELSVIEHRLTVLFDLMQKNQVRTFYPALIFNETFWQLPLEKRLSILISTQSDWTGEVPINKSSFVIDPFFLDLVRSVKISYFNYTKIDLPTLLNILMVKSKFEITSFASVGDTHNAVIKFNEINIKRENYTYHSKNSKSLLGKILAIDFYSEQKTHKKYKTLILTSTFSFELWEIFFESLHKIYAVRSEKSLDKLEFFVVFVSKAGYDYFQKNIDLYPALREAINQEIFHYEHVEIDDFNPREKFDLVFFDEIMSMLPTEIIIKRGNDFYHQTMRLVYYDRQDEQKALENIQIINSPISTAFDQQILKKLGYDIVFQKYDNSNITEFLENTIEVPERSLISMPIYGLRLIIMTSKLLNPQGKIYVLDYCEQHTNYLFFEDIDNFQRILLNEYYFINSLQGFDDIKVQIETQSIDTLISDEILENKDEIFRVQGLISFLAESTDATKELFQEENFKFTPEAKKMASKYKLFSSIFEKGIFTFGLGTLLYNHGLKRFYSDFSKTHKFIQLPEKIKSRGLRSYIKEVLAEIVPKIIEELYANSDMIGSFDQERKINEDINKLISRLHIKTDKFFEFINKHREKILKHSNNTNQTYKLIKITNAS